MPELPEVETTRRGVEGGVTGRVLLGAVVRNGQLRWPVPPKLSEIVAGQTVHAVSRRAKYLLFDLGTGHLILHLGMSGSLRLVAADVPPEKHDHIDLLIQGEQTPRVLRYRDPRRFGALLWQVGDVFAHPLLAPLGPEPLGDEFNATYLLDRLKGRAAAIKLLLMDNHIVVGVGNIYASESLFRAAVNPMRAGCDLSRTDCARLVEVVRETLSEAIVAGGSSLRDFVDTAGRPGYFQQQYFVYGRTDQPCHRCGSLIRQCKQGQRTTFWCPYCQAK